MNYTEAMAYLTHFPAWQPADFDAGPGAFGLRPMRELMRLLGDPQEKVPYVHIAGTNGKGSTAAFLHEILTESGLRCGLFTSPFFKEFRDEIRVGKDCISREALADCVTRVKAAAERLQKTQGLSPAKFEIETAIAFLHFAESACTVGVLEVGLGGRLDATNIIARPLLCLITAIDFDHTGILGDSLSAIAAEKAGIIKEKTAVLLFPQAEEVHQTVAAVCADKHARLLSFPHRIPVKSFDTNGQVFDIPGYLQDLHIPLLGSYQVKNAAAAASAARYLQKEKHLPVPEGAIRKGLSQTVWHGRFELAARAPAVILDGSHNPQGAALLAENLNRYFPRQKRLLVMGVLADKNYAEMADAILPCAEHVFTFSPPNPRSLSAHALAGCVKKKAAALSCERAAHRVTACPSLAAALTAAHRMAQPEDVIVLFGSLSSVGPADDAVKSIRQMPQAGQV